METLLYGSTPTGNPRVDEQRRHPRFPCGSALMFKDSTTGDYFDGRMANYSRGGMCFEADGAPSVGTHVFIGIDQSPNGMSFEVVRGEVIWCRRVQTGLSAYSCSVGIQYC